MNRFSRDANAAAAAPSPFGASRAATIEEPSAQQSFASGSPDEARRLLEEVQHMGSRMRLNRRRAQQIDRRAAAYASRLARHTARLLQHMPNAVPAVRPVPGTGASALRHYVLKHDQLESPDRLRLLVVSSDGRLRICTVLTDGPRTRLWNDYEVANPPTGLGLSVVFEGLSSMIVQLESAVTQAEAVAESHASALDGMIARSEAKLANAGSRLQPVEHVAEDEAEDSAIDVLFGDTNTDGLKSYGFEDRLR
ncbi:MAG: hypothetical protein ABI852_12835 [Gemmatimonadaceae bacterium]